MKTLTSCLLSLSVVAFCGCQAERQEVRDAVDNVKNSVEGVQDKMDAHNKRLEDMMNEDK